MIIFRRFISLVRLVKLKFTLKGFSFGLFSYIDFLSDLGRYVKLNGKSVIIDSVIGDYSYVSNAKVSNCSIGKFCSIGTNASVGGLGKHPIDMISTHPSFYSVSMQCGRTFSEKNYFDEYEYTYIGNDVWIGMNAIILDGVKVGNGVVIAAGAVVTTDIPSYAIVGGVPAKIIRYRFTESEIKDLERLLWWNWSEFHLELCAPIIRKGVVSELVDFANGNNV